MIINLVLTEKWQLFSIVLKHNFPFLTFSQFYFFSLKNFKDIDLVLIGSALSHVWINDHEYYNENPEFEAEVIYILFINDFLGKHFTALPEMQHIECMFKRAAFG